MKTLNWRNNICEKPTVLDLFCGIGGFSKGFEMADFNVIAGIDNWDIAIDTFQANHKDTKGILIDLTKVSNDFFEQCPKNRCYNCRASMSRVFNVWKKRR